MGDRDHQALVDMVPLDPELGRAIAAQSRISEQLDQQSTMRQLELYRVLTTPATYYELEPGVLVDALGEPLRKVELDTSRNPESLESWEQEGGDPIEDIQRACEMMRRAERERREWWRRRAFRIRSLKWFRGINPWS